MPRTLARRLEWNLRSKPAYFQKARALMNGTEQLALDDSSENEVVRGQRVLVVDDDGDLLDALEPILEAEGFRVHTAASVRDATRALSEREFDVVVTDLALGATGGLAFCETIARTRPDLPVIVLTGYRDAKSAAMRLGARRVLTKPIAAATLVTALREVTKRSSRLSDT
jgi:DNA-binding NtrC family response regulator